jgi:hypothetical protein
MTESLHRGFYENLFESRENFGAWIWMGYEETSAYDPAVSFIEFSLVNGVFEPFVVAIQDLDVELIGISEVVQDSGYYGLVVVFADAETVFSVT